MPIQNANVVCQCRMPQARGGRAAYELGRNAMALGDAPHGHMCDSKKHDISEANYANYANYARLPRRGMGRLASA